MENCLGYTFGQFSEVGFRLKFWFNYEKKVMARFHLIMRSIGRSNLDDCCCGKEDTLDGGLVTWEYDTLGVTWAKVMVLGIYPNTWNLFEEDALEDLGFGVGGMGGLMRETILPGGS